jgi:hypothetical protein
MYQPVLLCLKILKANSQLFLTLYTYYNFFKFSLRKDFLFSVEIYSCHLFCFLV